MENRKNHWEKIYSEKSPLEVSWYQEEPRFSLNMIHHSGIGKEEPVIDVGGGASVLVDCLLAEGYRRLAVLDISSAALAAAKSRLGAKASLVEWFETDITEFQPPHDFALWHDRAVFHFLTQAKDREKYVAAARKALRPQGQLILAAFAIGGPEKCSGLEVVQYDSKKLLGEVGDGFRLVEEAVEVHVTPAKKEQLFSYFRLLRS